MCWDLYQKTGNEDILTCILSCQKQLADFSSLNRQAWDLYRHLRARRPVGFGSVGALQYSEIEATFRLKSVPSYLWKYLTKRIEILDGIELEFIINKRNSESKPKGSYTRK